MAARGSTFGQRQPPLYISIQKILDKYPDGQIFKEIIQNADDAGATAVHFYLDNRRHGTDSLVEPKLAHFQGPALLAYNDAVFTDADWQSIQDLQQSVKTEDPFKVGKFGIGFNSVYHITDLPTILSGRKLAYLEPHEDIWIKETGQWYDIQKQADKLDTFAPFHDLHGFTRTDSFPGTFFRFPLRNMTREKRVSSHVYTVDKLRGILSALREEARVILLFLHSVVVVEVHEISEYGHITGLLRVCSSMGGSQLKQRSNFQQELKMAFRTHSYKIEHPIECAIKFQVKVDDYIDPSNSSQSEWLVASRVGSSVSEVHCVAEALRALPWVGVALEVSESTSAGGRVFCVLPMPSEVSCHLPVHVNATFSLNDERRELKWSGVERKNDPSADWNGLIVQHLLPPCYAGLLLGQAKEIMRGDSFYRAWPDISRVRYTNWEGLLRPLFQKVFSQPVFWSSFGWANYNNALFTPRDTAIPSVVRSVLTVCQETIVTIPAEVWDAIDLMSLSHCLSCITPQTVRTKLKRINLLQMCSYSSEQKLELLQYCLSDGAFHDIVGVDLLPLVNSTFSTFASKKLTKAVYLCSLEYPSYIIPSCKHRLVDIDSGSLHESLVSVAKTEVTQLVQLNASCVTILLRECLPTGSFATLPHGPINIQWLELFWGWAARQPHLLPFSGLLVVPAHDPLTQETCVVRLGRDCPAVFSETSISTSLLNVLGKFNVKCCEKSRFSFVCTLGVFLMNQLSPDGVLDAIRLASHHRHALTTQEATSLRAFLCGYSKNQQRVSTLKELTVFTTLSEVLYSVNQVRSAQIEPDKFPLSSSNLPSQLVLFSGSEYQQLWLLRSLSVPQPTSVDLLVNSVFPLISNSTNCVNLMKEVLDNIHVILSSTNVLQKQRLKAGIGKLLFIPVVKGGSELHTPADLFNPSDPLLQRLFRGKLVFPVEPFHSEKCLAVLRSCGLKTAVSPQQIVDTLHQITTTAGKGIRSVDTTTYTRARAVLECMSKWGAEELSERVTIVSKRVIFSRVILFFAENKSWLPIQATPPEDYPDSLCWKGRGQSQHLVSHGPSTILCHKPSLLQLACGSQVHFVDHSLPVVMCELFTPDPSILVRHAMAHLQLVANSSQLSQEQLRDITRAVYQLLNNHVDPTVRSKGSLPPEWFYISRMNVFVSPSVVAVEQNASFRRNLEPFIYTLPDDLHHFSPLFKSLGVAGRVSTQQIVGILGKIKQGGSSDLGIGRREAWELVMAILNWLTGNGEHPVSVSDCGTLYVPIEDPSSNWPTLEESEAVVYTDNNFLKRYVGASQPSDGHSYKFIHESVSQQMAQMLHIAPLSQFLDVAEDAFEDVGQSEPLTVRLRNILKDYKDGLTILKELLQNADDAEATEVNICYDARNHSVSPSQLLFPGMAGCHGPALVFHNNAVFTQDDFKNITKLAGATKAGKALKIGKFGVGFCSVYHMTDIPSFISSQYLYMFDPTLAYLKEDIKNLAQPGKRVTHCTNMVMNSQQLAPYQGLFGFEKGQQYQGTMFRFPFRTAPTELSSTIYTPRVVEDMFDGIGTKGSELLLFLQRVKCVRVHKIVDGQQSPQLQMEITKEIVHVPEKLVSIVQVSCSSGDTRYWLVATHTETVLGEIATASVACSLDAPAPYTPQAVEGEVFCFLPLSVKTGLPVHISSNFAVTNNRTGLWTSDDHSTSNIHEVKWNESLMKIIIPLAYFKMLVSLQKMSLTSQLEKYLFYALWPLGADLTIRNPWKLMIDALYHGIGQSNLFFSTCANEWLPLSKGRFLSPGILSINSSTIPECVLAVAHHLKMPVINLPRQYHVHLKNTQSISEDMFLRCFFMNVNSIPAEKRNDILCLALECYATELDQNSERKCHLHSCLTANACIPCTPDGMRLRKCSEVVSPRAEFAALYEEDEGLFPLKTFHEKPLVSKAMEVLGIISSNIPMAMLKERAQTVCVLYKQKRSEALQRTRLILNCVGSYTSHYEEDEELASIPFLPVMPNPEGYLFRWFGNKKELVSGKELMLKGETSYLGNKRRNVYIAGSQVPFTNELRPEDGGCGYLSPHVRKVLKVREEPFPNEVLEHFKHIINVFNRQSTHGEEIMKEMSAIVHNVYQYLEGALTKQHSIESSEVAQGEQGCNVDLADLSTLPCIWTGIKFVFCEKVAQKWKTSTGPYLYRVPDGHFSNLWKTLNIKQTFTAFDLIAALKEISDTFGSKQVPEHCHEALKDIISELMDQEIPKDIPTTMLPNESFVMHKATSLAFNDAQWLPPDEVIMYVKHALVTRELAEKLGVKMVRSQVLEKHRLPFKGQKFGQSEKLTTRIQGILQDYPFDVTILKELLQNADDAKATKMYVILDKRTHATERVLSKDWQQLQGPALLVWNDSVFSERDIEGIQNLGIGNKRSDADTIGQYGIGFNSVYHLTDCPSFVTADMLCIFDPHCKYTPDSSREFPGEMFELSILSDFPDMKPAYLHSNVQGGSECNELLSGSLFRFPLRHTPELVDASEIVCANVGSKIFEGVLTASGMDKYLRKWAPQMKQSMFFLNHVTELKFFVISEGGDNQLSLEHHYQVNIDSLAITRRKELHQKLVNFNEAQGTEPFVTKYQLSLTDKVGDKKLKEKWLIQQGVGDINNTQQKWEFIEQVTPRHGIAVSLRLATDTRKFRGRVFCFLPLPLDCNLPVHINGHFILHSSRRALWKTTDRDDIDSKQQWNTSLLRAIANSYAQLLMTIKEDYRIESGEVDSRDIKRYYQTFPSWTAPPVRSSLPRTNPEHTEGSQRSLPAVQARAAGKYSVPLTRESLVSTKSTSKIPHLTSSHTLPTAPTSGSNDKPLALPANEWLTLAESVFRTLAAINAPVIAILHAKYNKHVKKKVHTIEWCPLKHKDPASQVHFIDKNISSPPMLVFERIGMKITDTQFWVRKHFEHVKCAIPTVTSKNAYEYYTKFHEKVLPANRSFPCPVQITSFKSVEHFKEFSNFILQSQTQHNTPEICGEEEVVGLSDTPPIQYPPLVVTADGMLRYCNKQTDAVIKSSFFGLFEKYLQYFLHPQLADIKLPQNFILTPSEENEHVCMQIIDQCLSSILPVHLAHVPHTVCPIPPVLGKLWKCLRDDHFFKRFLKNILKKWALLLSKSSTLYSCFLETEAVLPIIPLENDQQSDYGSDDDGEIGFEIRNKISTVCQHLTLPFLNTETVRPPAVKGICPTLVDPAFMLQVLYNFHCQSDIAQFMTGNMADTLFTYFGHIHLKKDGKSLNYLKQLPLFQTHQGTFTSISGKTVYRWPSQMCTDGQEMWLDDANVVFLHPNGAWSRLELSSEFEVYSIYPTEIYCQFVFRKFEEMNETLRYEHLQHIRDCLFEEAKTHSQQDGNDKRDSSQIFILKLTSLECIGSDHALKAVREFHDHENTIFSTFQDNFLFLPTHFRVGGNYVKWKNFLKQLGFHVEITPKQFLVLCREMANKQHIYEIREKSCVLFEHLFEKDTQEWFRNRSFLLHLTEIPFVLAEKPQGYTWIAKTPPEKYAKGTCVIQTDEDEPVYLTKLNEACTYNDVKLVWSVKPVYHAPWQSKNPFKVLSQLRVNYRATVSDVIHHLVTISDTGRADPQLFDTYTAPLPSKIDVGLIDVIAKCFEFLKTEGAGDRDLDILKMTPCIPVPACDGNKSKIVLVRPDQALTTDLVQGYFPYLHKVPNELMASAEVLERIGVMSSIQLSHIQFVLNAVHDQLQGEVIDPNTKKIICLAMSQLFTVISLQNNHTAGKELSPLYLPGRDNRMHHTSKLVYPDSYSYKGCTIPESTSYVLLHHPNPEKDQFNFANQFCNALPKAVRPKPLSELCNQQLLQECTSECEDIDMASCLKTALKLEQLPTVCLSTFTKYAKHSIKLDDAHELLSSFFQSVQVVTVHNLQVKLAMKNDASAIGTATVEFYLRTDEDDDFCLYLDSNITRMVEEHIHKTVVRELLGAINNKIGTATPGVVIPQIQEAFCLFLKSQTNENLRNACNISKIELDDADFVRALDPQIGHPIPEEWQYLLDQNPDNIFHPQEIVGYETSERVYIFAQVLYAVPPEEVDYSEDSRNPLLSRYVIAIPDGEILVTALDIYKFTKGRRDNLAITNTDQQETAEEREHFSDAAEAKRHLCKLLKQIWRMGEPERGRAIRRLYLQWHPDKNLDNVELASEVFKFLKKQIERLEQGLDPEEEDEDGVSAFSPSPQWQQSYRAWDEMAGSHSRHRSHHTHYFGSRPSGGGGGVRFPTDDWQKPQPNFAEGQRWVMQAFYDLMALEALYEKAATNSKLYSHVCFMAHEVAEKALKGGMYATCGLHGMFLKDHQVVQLANALRGERMELASDLPSLTWTLAPYYLDTRFPNRCPGSVPSDRFTSTHAQEARESAVKILTVVQSILSC